MAYTFKHGDRPIEGLTVQRAVGRGGFGEVYYALTDSGKQVAVKYLRENPEVELRGIAQVMNLKSPHLITIYDVRQNADGEPFVIMEYVSGPSLRELLIAEPNGLGRQKAAFFIKGIAAGLSYLHERGIVHRDLKPGNIFYDDGYVKIGDYGLSKHIAVSAHSGNTISVGTVHYMAPEIGSGSYTKSIDIYAMGVMLYEMLTGRLPFTGSSMGEVLMRHLSDQPDLSGLPEPFASVIAKALAKDPRDRYQDTDEMVEALTSATDVSESLESFDASVLAQTPRVEYPADADRTVTTPPRAPAVPALDAREPFDLPPIPPIPAVFGAKDAKRARKLQEKAYKVRQRAERKARAMHAKLADMGLGPGPRIMPEADRPVGRKRWQQVAISLIVLFAVSGGLGIIREDGVVFGASLLFLFLGMLGTLLAYKLSARRNSIEYDFQDRLLYAACGFVFMLPAYAAGHEVGFWDYGYSRWSPSGFQLLIVPLTATLLLFNWNDRIQMGRRHLISGGTVFWHALLALIVAGPLTNGRFAWEAAALSAGLVILVQSVAGIWRLAVPDMAQVATPPPRPPRGERVWNSLEGAYQRIATAVESVSERLEKTGARDAQTIEPNGTVKVDESSEAPPATPEAATPAKGTLHPALAQGYQPSFVGRTANAGLAFLAKLLLLVGLLAAPLFSPGLLSIDEGGTSVVIDQGRVHVSERHGTDVHVIANEEIPRAAVIAPLMLGTVLLVVSRRNDGVAHFLRGFIGCAFAFGAAVMAMGPASEALGAFLSTGNLAGCCEEALIEAGIMLGLSLVLLFWPRRRQPGTIVV